MAVSDGEQDQLSEAGRIILAGRDQAEDALAGLDRFPPESRYLRASTGEDALAGLGKQALAALGSWEWTNPVLEGRADQLRLLDAANLAAGVDRSIRGLLDQPMVSAEALHTAATWGPLLGQEDKERLLGMALGDLVSGSAAAKVAEMSDLVRGSFSLGERANTIFAGVQAAMQESITASLLPLAQTMSESAAGLVDQLGRVGDLYGRLATTQATIAGLLNSPALSAPGYNLAGAALWQESAQRIKLAGALQSAFTFESHVADLLAGPGLWPPAVISRQPEPEPQPEPPALEPVQLAGQWPEVLTHVIAAGIASPKDVLELVLTLAQQHASGVKPPTWAEVEAVARAYKERGHRYTDQGAFARAIGYSRATVQRCLSWYEAATGEQVRPGRGRGRRKLM